MKMEFASLLQSPPSPHAHTHASTSTSTSTSTPPPPPSPSPPPQSLSKFKSSVSTIKNYFKPSSVKGILVLLLSSFFVYTIKLVI